MERAWTPPHAAIDPTASGKEHAEGVSERLVLHRHWQRPEEIAIEQGAGAHGGGDALLLDDVFRGPSEDPLARQAGYRAGVASVMIGVSANLSAATGAPVGLTDVAPERPTDARRVRGLAEIAADGRGLFPRRARTCPNASGTRWASWS